MALSPGVRLGVYEVRELIGAGGMGEVYRALDTKLNRDVALKILPDIFASDSDRLARFKREAQVLASLNHSNIAAILFEYARQRVQQPHSYAPSRDGQRFLVNTVLEVDDEPINIVHNWLALTK